MQTRGAGTSGPARSTRGAGNGRKTVRKHVRQAGMTLDEVIVTDRSKGLTDTRETIHQPGGVIEQRHVRQIVKGERTTTTTTDKLRKAGHLLSSMHSVEVADAKQGTDVTTSDQWGNNQHTHDRVAIRTKGPIRTVHVTGTTQIPGKATQHVDETTVTDSRTGQVADTSNLTHQTVTTELRTQAPAVSASSLARAQAALRKQPASWTTYNQVRTAMGKGIVGNIGRRQLDALLVAGTLAIRDTRGQTMLHDLGTIASRPLAHRGTDRGALLRDVIADALHPSTISQGIHDTCTASGLQQTLAATQPAEYARLVAGLATGNGKVQLRDNSGTLDVPGFYQAPDRSSTSNLLAPALMGLEAHNEGARYADAQDRFVLSGRGTQHGIQLDGATDEDLAYAASKVLGQRYVVSTGSGLASILQAVTAKQPVFARIPPLPGANVDHMVQVLAYDGHQVTYRNPAGEVDTVPHSAFKPLAAIHPAAAPQGLAPVKN